MNCILLCEQCGMTFASHDALQSHSELSHKVPQAYSCDVCNKSFRDAFGLKRHIKSVHEKSNETIRSMVVNCPLCNYKGMRATINKHFFETHNIELVKKCFVFADMNQFSEWKKSMECETKSVYIKRRSSNTNTDGAIVSHLYCHRDGHFTSKGANRRTMKVMGSNKIGAHCPSFMKITQGENVCVEFIATHVGHSFDVARMTLSEDDKRKFASQMQMKVPMDGILNNIRDTVVGDEVTRLHLTNRKDLHNITHQYNLNNDAALHDNDYVSVDVWVKKMQATSNIIRLYKPQGQSVADYPQLKAEDFCLVIANETQLQLLSKFGNDCICIDGTHGLNGYNFELFTLLVLDDMRQGFPCAFMFCNRSDTVTMELYFKTIISCLDSELKPKWFMSDMAESFFNAWMSIQPDSTTKQLYCSWHVDRVWQQNLSKVTGKEKQIEVYKKIKVLMYERDTSSFEIMAKNLLVELYDSELTRKFARYIEKFINVAPKWAYCYRMQAGINTNMALENLHKNLKHIYLQSKKVKRLDKGIHALMKFLRDKLFDRLIIIHRGKITKKLSSLRIRHKWSKELSEKSVCKVDSGEWNVRSEKSGELYVVSVQNINCNCNLRCIDCSACLHTFSCTCSDAAIAWNMCKHMHLVCQFIKVNDTTDAQDVTNSDKQQIESLEEERTILQDVSCSMSKHDDTDIQAEKLLVIEKFTNIVNTIKTNQGPQALKKFISPLDFVVQNAEIINVANYSSALSTSKEPANKKIEPQRHLFSTKKKNIRKKGIKRPSDTEVKKIAQELVLPKKQRELL